MKALVGRTKCSWIPFELRPPNVKVESIKRLKLVVRSSVR